jgi:hypothetical protein
MSHKWQHVERQLASWEIGGSHSDEADDSGLLGYDAVSLCRWFPKLQRNVVPASSRFKQYKKSSSSTA